MFKRINRKRYKVIFLLVLLAAGNFSLPACTQKPAAVTQTIKDITAQEAFSLIQENNDNLNFVIIDVRTPEEFAAGHIENALNIDFLSDSFTFKMNNLAREKKYLIYCRSGNRSRGALNVMKELGFKEIYHLSEGITGWVTQGLTIEECEACLNALISETP